MSSLPVRRPFEITDSPEQRRWLLEPLWADQAVGILGGEPKCCKSFLALDIAVAVASGTACLRRFQPAQTGPVLLYAAEDSLPVVRRRLEGIARAAEIDFKSLDIHVITSPTLRLDDPSDRSSLRETVEAIRPKLLILDPFVRLHQIDENSAGEVAPLLTYLRNLQRMFQTAVILVHHARKASHHVRAGQALRGSSELHAWGDSNLYLRWQKDKLVLTVEHRAQASQTGLSLQLKENGDALALQFLDQTSPAQNEDSLPSTIDRIEQALLQSTSPLTRDQLRSTCRIRTASLSQILAQLTTSGRILKSQGGYQLATS